MKRMKWKENKLLTILMIILTPIISFCLMEGITGNITVQMYPCSEGTDTGSPAL